ncbi:MAG: biotin carboxylase N-terminal domain-containing protein [Chloroflexota bacterium]
MPTGQRPPFERLLIANRGEIAVRVIRACADLGIRSIAVYSVADRDALHVRMADEAHPIGPGRASESYLSIPRILNVARATGAQAIHPGYGFLSESAAFAEACAAAGLTFVGPPPSAMELAGDKAAARRLAVSCGVPVVPGYDGPEQSDAALTAEAERVGFPLLVKAAAGGGGRGMRAAASRAELPEALAAARREALAAFGDDTLILERLIVQARHVEVQVLGDNHGGVIHLGERDCSVQRRHQKVVEESPAPGLSSELRAALGDAAVRIARAAGYTNAGTCEFLLGEDGQFWFIEMNARLQVEHPVTEAVTRLDLVKVQLEIAAGEPLPWRQEDVHLRGHAVEVRLYAEDPSRNDLPTPGRLRCLQLAPGVGLRHDLGYVGGDVVPPFYDTMIGKLIAYGDDRAEAIARARAGLDALVVDGLPTNRELLGWILDHPLFREGGVTTDFLDVWRTTGVRSAAVPDDALAAAVALCLAADEADAGASHAVTVPDWRIAGQGVTSFWLVGDEPSPVTVVADREGGHTWRITIRDTRYLAAIGDPLAANAVNVVVRTASADGAWSDTPSRYLVVRGSDGVAVQVDGHTWRVRRAPPPDPNAVRTRHAAGGSEVLQAPMPGRVVRVAVAVGDTVVARQQLVVVEAMKIENAVTASRDGVVSAVHCAVGDAVAGGQVLVELLPL